jgi:uncharacterized repeat protein (TIGR01451 family)
MFTALIFILSGLTAYAKPVFAAASPEPVSAHPTYSTHSAGSDNQIYSGMQDLLNGTTPGGVNDVSSDPAAADLSITQSNTDTSIYVNAVFSTTLTITNHGPDAAENVRVNGTSSVAGPAVLYYSGWYCVTWDYHLSCRLDSLAAGDSATIDIAYAAPAEPETLEGEFTVSSDASDEDLTNNVITKSLIIKPLPSADLSVTQSTSASSVFVNASLPWTLSVHNDGPDDAQNVTLTSTFTGAQSVATEDEGWTCSTVDTTLTCTLSSLAANATANLSLTVTAPAAPGSISGQAQVGSNTIDPQAANNQHSKSVTVKPLPSADLSTTQSSSAASVYTADTFTLTLKVQNDGPDAAQPVTVTDQISGAQNVTFNSPAGWDCSTANETVTCTAASLDAGAAVELEFTISAPGAPGTVASQANAVSDTADPQPANNASTRSVEVARRPLADLSITQSGAAAVHPTDVFPLTLTVHNDGPDAAQNVLVTQTIQGAQQFDFSGNPSWDCTAAANTLSCLLNQLAAGEDASLQVTLTAPNAEGTLASQANVASDTADPQSANNTASKTIAITHLPNADLAVSQTTSVEEALVGSQFTTTLTVSNDGPDAAQDLVLTTAITGPQEVTVDAGDWECTVENHQLVCKLAELPEGETADLILTITTPDTPVQINTQSTVTSATLDSEESNNQAAASVSVRALSAALSITQASSASAVVAENPLTFTLSVANQGPDAAQNVLVTAALSDGVTFVSASGTGWDCSYAAGEVTCERASLAVNIVTAITLNVTAPAAPGVITSQANVQSDTPDPSAADNQATTQVLVGASPVTTGVKIYLPVVLK